MNLEKIKETEENSLTSVEHSFFDTIPHGDLLHHFSSEYEMLKEENKKIHIFIQDMFLEHFFP